MRRLRPVAPLMHQTGVGPGFTLTELLTTIAVIAILAGLLIPVGMHVRESAQSAACQSNLRQIGTAFRLYMADNRNRSPKAYDSQSTLFWYQYLTGTSYVAGVSSGTAYLEAQSVLKCPSDKGSKTVSYGMTDLSVWYPALHRPSAIGDELFYANLKRPAEWPLVMDADETIIYGLDSPTADVTDDHNRFDARHDGWANVVMVDGHIERVRYGDTRWSQHVLNDGSYYTK